MLLETWLTFKCMLLIKIQIIWISADASCSLDNAYLSWNLSSTTSGVNIPTWTLFLHANPSMEERNQASRFQNPESPTVCKTIFSDSEECTKNRKCFSIFYQSLVLSLIRQFSNMRASESTETFFSAIYKSED